MIKDGVVNVLGALIDNVVPGEAEPCPKCHGTDLEIVRDIEMQPQGFRVKGSKCGHEVPEEYAEYAYIGEEGIARALEIWNALALTHDLKGEPEADGALMENVEDEIQAVI